MPCWGLKLRSHPDKVLPLLEVVLDSFVSGLAGKCTESNDAWKEAQQQLLEAVERQLKSTKKDVRVIACQTLILLAKLGLEKEIGERLADAVSGLGSSELRLGAYTALEGVANVFLEGDGKNETMSMLADEVLTSLCGILPKDKNSTDGAKEIGFTSLLSWMQCSKRAGRGSGYDKALDYFLEAIEKYAALKGEFRFRLGNLVVSSNHGEAFAESIVVDLFEKKGNAVAKSLETIVETVAKKFKATDTIPQTDGVLATFLLVTYAHSKGEIPASIAKVFKDGSFLYGAAVLETVKTDTLLNYLVHRTIAMHVKTSCKDHDEDSTKPLSLVRLLEKKTGQPSQSDAALTLAVCVANSLCVSPKLSAYSSALSSLKTVITYAPVSTKASQSVLLALFSYMNETSLKNDDAKMSVNDNYEIKEVDESMNKLPSDATREPLSEDAFFKSIRCAANVLVSSSNMADSQALWKGLLLTHAGTTECSSRRQRVSLVSHLLDALKEKVVPIAENSTDTVMDELADFITMCAAAPTLEYPLDQSNEENGDKAGQAQSCIGKSTHKAACSLINSFGGIAGSFDAEFDDDEDNEKKPYAFASKLCTDKLPACLVAFMNKSLSSIESLSEDDISLYLCPEGVLFKPNGENDGQKNSGANSTAPKVEKKAATKKVKGGGGFDAFADEEWERQVRKDLAKKKAQAAGPTVTTLSAEDKKLLDEQSSKRVQVSSVIDVCFPRTLAAIRCLCESDIEVGNASLPCLGKTIIRVAVSPCEVLSSLYELQQDSFDTLVSLSGCVYEIDEIHARTLARALVTSFGVELKQETEDGKKESELVIKPLPSTCPSAACAIFEMEEYGDCLSGNSFSFLFPIIAAALSGPRNITGCDSALQVLGRHFTMLDGDEVDPIVKPMRKEIALSLLELLSHDRCQTFTNPTPYEALIGCYDTNEESTGSPLSASEIAPLLGENGALGVENQRVATMATLASIAEDHAKFVRSNPLIENRMWLNCHASQERIKFAARKAWLLSHEHDVPDDLITLTLDAPSKMYAVPLLPLLSHEDKSIASAAATALSSAIGMHAETAEKNVIKVCNLYIGSFPAPGSDEPAKSSLFPVPVAAVAKKPVKKVIDTGLKKKPAPKKVSGVSSSLAKITGAPAPKKKAATKALLAKTAPKERTLDENELMGQFMTQPSVKRETGEADTESKVAIRLGVLRAVSSFTEPSANVKLDLHTLKILIGFLIAFGLGDVNEEVRNAARDAARDIVASFGSSKEVIAFFLPQFESVLNTGKADVTCIDPLSPEKVPLTIAASDYRKEGVVILLGSIALHLNDISDAEKIDGIIDMLLNALKTPVSYCMLCLHSLLSS